MLAHEIRGSGEWVTLLHGFMQDRTSWREVVELVPEAHRWLFVDLPGHGGSAREAATMPAAAGALAELWEALGVERTHLVGYSLGGRLALYTCLRHPDRVHSLLTLGAHCGLEGPARERRLKDDAELARRVEALGTRWFAEHWAGLPLFAGLARRGPAVLRRLDRMRSAQDAEGIAASLRGMGGAAVAPFWDEVPRIACRATFAAGAEDAPYVAHARRLQAAVAGSRVALIPEAGHAAHLERPDAFAAELRRHLAAQSATR